MTPQTFPFSKNRYFPRKRMRSADFIREQTYVEHKLAFLSQWDFGAGVALGLDVATYFDVNFSDEDVKRLEESDKKEADFLANAIRFVKKRGFDAYCTVIDCMAVAYAIDPTLVETMEAHVGVETKDGLTLGMTVIDRRHHFVWEQLPLIQVGCSADCGRFLQMLLELVLK